MFQITKQRGNVERGTTAKQIDHFERDRERETEVVSIERSLSGERCSRKMKRVWGTKYKLEDMV